jgi:hypothetical protein
MISSSDDVPRDEIVRRMERGIRWFFATPPKPHGKNPAATPPKKKARPASKGRVNQAKSRS